MQNSSIRFFEWNHIWYVTFGLDEFSSNTACVMPQNSSFDDWISFPEIRSSSFFRNSPIRDWFLLEVFGVLSVYFLKVSYLFSCMVFPMHTISKLSFHSKSHSWFLFFYLLLSSLLPLRFSSMISVIAPERRFGGFWLARISTNRNRVLTLVVKNIERGAMQTMTTKAIKAAHPISL